MPTVSPLNRYRKQAACGGCGNKLPEPMPAHAAYCQTCWGYSAVRRIVEEAHEQNRRNRSAA